MNYKPIVNQRTIDEYQCPRCEFKTQSINDIERHISLRYELTDIEKDIKVFGDTAYFTTEQEANRYCQLRTLKAGDGLGSDVFFYYKVIWFGPGKYRYKEQRKESGGFWDTEISYTYTYEKIN